MKEKFNWKSTALIRFLRVLWLPLAIAVAARLILLGCVLHTSGIAGIFTLDTPGYINPIAGMLHGSFSVNHIPEIVRTPGYPLFLLIAGLGKVHPLLWVSWQIALSALSVAVLYLAALSLFPSQRAAYFCALLYAFEPNSVLCSILLIADALLTCFLIFFIYFLLSYLRTGKWRWLSLTALALVICAYIKPVAYYLPPCVAVGLIFLPRQLPAMQRLYRAASFMAICVILIGLWQYRNYKETGYPGFTSIAETQIYYFDAAGVIAKQEHKDFFSTQLDLGYMHPNKYSSLHPEQSHWTLDQKLKYQKSTALSILKKHPLLFAKLQLRGVAVVAFDPRGIDMLRHLNRYPTGVSSGLISMVVNKGIPRTLLWVSRNKPALFFTSIFLGGILLSYYLLAILGIPDAYRFRDAFWTLVLLAAYLLFVAGGPAASGRYRDPVMPIVCLFAGAGLARLLHGKWRSGET